MKTSVKIALALVGVGALVTWLVVAGEQQDARMTAKGSALVTAVSLREDAEGSSLDTTEFELTVRAGESEVEAKASLPGNRTADFRAGQTVTVCYNPADPTEVDVELTAAAICGS